MKKTALSSILVVVVLLAAVTAEAQQSTKIPRRGYLSGGFASSGAPRIDGFRQGLGELGYVEGKNIVIESRHAGKTDRIPALAKSREKTYKVADSGGLYLEVWSFLNRGNEPKSFGLLIASMMVGGRFIVSAQCLVQLCQKSDSFGAGAIRPRRSVQSHVITELEDYPRTRYASKNALRPFASLGIL